MSPQDPPSSLHDKIGGQGLLCQLFGFRKTVEQRLQQCFQCYNQANQRVYDDLENVTRVTITEKNTQSDIKSPTSTSKLERDQNKRLE